MIEEHARKIELAASNTPLVYEPLLDLEPGPYRVLALAREAQTGQLGTQTLQGQLRLAEGREVAVAATALMQPVKGLFVRRDAQRTQGLAAVGGEVDPRRPLLLVSLLCRGEKFTGALTAERRLVGSNAAPFPPIQVTFEKNERCVQLRDLVRREPSAPGGFSTSWPSSPPKLPKSAPPRRPKASHPAKPRSTASASTCRNDPQVVPLFLAALRAGSSICVAARSFGQRAEGVAALGAWKPVRSMRPQARRRSNTSQNALTLNTERSWR